MFNKKEDLILRPIQIDMVDRVRESFRTSKRVILQAATASGKTAIAAKIFQRAIANGKRCLFIADRIVLVLQTSEEFNRWGIRHGIIMADHPDYFPDRPVQVASASTLINRDIGQFDVIIQDEAHTIHKGAIKAFDANPEAFILGLTASPYAKGLGKIFETHVQPYTVKELIDKGLLVDYDVFAPCPIDLTHVRTVAGEYRKDDLGKAVNDKKLTADIIQTYIKIANGKKAICFATNVAHGRALSKEFNKAGIQAKDINAYLPKEGEESSKAIIQEFRDNNFKVLISVAIIIKGFNVPDVEVCILATATKSMIKLTQTVGRVLRLSPGKEKALILDHGTNFERMGYPDEYEFYELDDGKHQDSKNKQQEQIVKLPKVCPSCAFLKPAGVLKCPRCGFQPKFIQDVEVSEGELQKIKRRNNRIYTREEKQSWLNQLNEYCSKKRWSPGAASQRYKQKFGVWPNAMEKGKYEPVGKDVLNFIRHQNIKYAHSKSKKA